MDQPFLETRKLEKLQRNQTWWNLLAMLYTSLISSNRLSGDTDMSTCFNNRTFNNGIMQLIRMQNLGNVWCIMHQNIIRYIPLDI